MEQLKITTYGHACFSMEYDGYRIVLDPYAWGSVPGLPDLHLEAEAVYCSHGHDDHCFTQAVTLRETGRTAPYTVEEYRTAHDHANGTKRGMNTVRIFRFGGLSVAHLGDLGCLPDGELARALRHVDCMLIPVGGFFTIGAEEAWKTVCAAEPRVVIPMHYRTDSAGYDVIGRVEEFAKLAGNVRYADRSFLLTPETEKQIMILNYKP